MEHTIENIIKVARKEADIMMANWREATKDGDNETATHRFWEYHGMRNIIDLLEDEDIFQNDAKIFLKEDE